MFQNYNQDIIIVTTKNMFTYNEVKAIYPEVKIVIQNFAIEHSIPDYIIKIIENFYIHDPLWIHFSVDINLQIYKILIYEVKDGYELIDDFYLNFDQLLQAEEKIKIAKKILILKVCNSCKYNTKLNLIHCAVNPKFELDDNNNCNSFCKL